MMENLKLIDVPYEADIRELMSAFGYYPELYALRANAATFSFTMDGETFTSHIYDNRFDTKCDLKRELYKALSRKTGRTLPWGTLTGIRPTKLAMEGIDFKSTFLTSDEKIKLCFETAKNEAELLNKADLKNGVSLYIGIPFCPTTCRYCSFTSYPIGLWKEKQSEYVDALIKEIKETAEICEGKKLETVYLGGGTPTSLKAQELDRILKALRENWDLKHLRELTCEAGRPDSITEEKLVTLKENNVTRISVNPQSMNDETLKRIGRRHSADMVRDSFRLARSVGFDNINMDIIIGLPGEDVADVRYTMEELEKLGPDSITVHTLAIKHGSGLGNEELKYEHTDAEIINEMSVVAGEYCRQNKLRPYYLYRQKNMAGNLENVGYAAKGKEGLYNVLIMEEAQPIIGCGAGSSSKIPLPEKGVRRIENVKDPGVYIERIDDMIMRKREELWH